MNLANVGRPRINDPNATEAAWRIHGQLTDWIGKVDSKASFILTLETAVLASIVAYHNSNAGSNPSIGKTDAVFYAGTRVLLALGILLSALAVAPSLSLSLRKERAVPATQDYIFFGDLRTWSPSDLPNQLGKDVLPALSRQLVVLSKIAWRKHLFLLWSMIAAGAGAALAGVMLALT